MKQIYRVEREKTEERRKGKKEIINISNVRQKNVLRKKIV